MAPSWLSCDEYQYSVSNCHLGSNWEMFWPAFEMIASAASLLMLVSCSLIFSCLMGDNEAVGEIVEPEVEDLKSDA